MREVFDNYFFGHDTHLTLEMIAMEHRNVDTKIRVKNEVHQLTTRNN
jgi:hypothetical protein